MDVEAAGGTGAAVSRKQQAGGASSTTTSEDTVAPYHSMPSSIAIQGEEGEGQRSKLWDSLTKLRWAECIVLLIILILSLKGTGRHQNRRLYIPQVTQVSSGGGITILANATAFSYPLLFDDGETTCSPVVLQQCLDGAVADVACCDALTAKKTPHQTVPNKVLIVICTLIPIGLILIRHLLHHLFNIQVAEGEDRPSLLGTLMGYLFALALAGAVTNSFKNLVGYPRPNHYAMVLYARTISSASKAQHYITGSFQSFPSGHCSLSMAVGLYVSLLYLSDIRRHAMHPITQHFRAILAVFALAPVFLSLYVATSRIFDFFHTPADATCGLAIGASFALIAYWYAIPSNTIKTKPNPSPKYCS